jgi:pSer/pThr/pTyr-binding forkhead associated (FHA) protein
MPTHVLHRGIAHAIDPAPFLVGVDIPEGYRGLNVSGDTAGISRHHVSLHRADGKLVVEDHSRYGTYLNGERIDREAKVRSGDKLRLGTPGIEVQLIEVKS